MASYHHFSNASIAGTPLRHVLRELIVVREEVADLRLFPAKRLPWLVILLTEAGEAINEAGLRRLPQRPGSLSIQPQGLVSGDRITQAPWRMRYILLAGPLAARFQDEFWPTGKLETELYDTVPSSLSRLVVDVVEAVFNQPPGWAWRTMAKLGELLDLLVHRPPDGHSFANLLEQAQRLVANDLQNPWRMPSLAEALRLDRRTLARHFRRITNRTPAQWVRQQRMQLAVKLLRQGMRVNAVAEQLGFSNPFCFSRQFKAVMHLSPSRIRQCHPLRRG